MGSGTHPRQEALEHLEHVLGTHPRVRCAQLPTPIHRIANLGAQIGLPELWIKRDDLAGLGFDDIVHCTGSSSTQSGLLADYTALGSPVQIVGISDDDETFIKRRRVHELARAALAESGIDARVDERQVHVGGTPALHAYASQFGSPQLIPFHGRHEQTVATDGR